MKTLNSEGFMKKYNLDDATMNESDLRRIYNFHKNPRDSKSFLIKDL